MTTETSGAHAAAIHNRVVLQARGEHRVEADVLYAAASCCSVTATARTPAYCVYCTLMLTVAVLLARLGSGVSAMVAAFSVVTVPAGTVTFTVRCTVHVVLG